MGKCVGLAALLLLVSCSVLGRSRVGDPALLFFDDFRDNRNGWLIEETDRTRSDIDHGRYVITKKGRRGISSRTHECGLNQQKDFLIEAVLTKIEGYDDFGYGMTWGTTSTWDTYKFLITGDGRFLYGRVRYNEWQGMDGFEPSPSIRPGNGTNKLTLKKVGSRLLLLINDDLVHEAAFEAFSPNNVGFTLEDRMKIEVESLVVRTLEVE